MEDAVKHKSGYVTKRNHFNVINLCRDILASFSKELREKEFKFYNKSIFLITRIKRERFQIEISLELFQKLHHNNLNFLNP